MVQSFYKQYTPVIFIALQIMTPFSLVVASGGTECSASLDDIYLAEKSVTDDSMLRTYILCPGRSYNVATQFSDDGTPVNGQYPIPLARSNIHILCGEDGKSENSCTLKRGLVHVGVVDEFNIGKPLNNTLVQGITFQRSNSVNILATIQGDLTVRDCIFKFNKNVAPIFATVPSSARRKLSLTGRDVLSVVSEQRQGNNKERYLKDVGLHIEISNCLFLQNSVGYSPGAVTTALILSHGAQVEISDSAFVATKNEAGVPGLSHIIFINGADLSIQNTCFFGNDDDIAPILITDGVVTARSNFAQRTSSILPTSSCEFITIANGGGADDGSYSSCLMSDSVACSCSSCSWKNHVPCMNNLNDLYDSEEAVWDDTITRTYILCPDTTYGVAESINDDGNPIRGSYPIVLAHSNIRILCGIDGSSKNNCKLSGGTVQLALHDEFEEGGQIVDALVQGLTFQQAKSINVIANFFGDVTFEDCIFRDNNNFSPIFAQLPDESRRRLQYLSLLTEKIINENGHRQMQNDEVREGGINFNLIGCQFIDNVIGSKGFSSGLIINQKVDFKLEGNTFVNTVNVASGDKVAFLVGNFMGNMYLTDNCFYYNQASMAPVINQNGTIHAINNSGFLVTDDSTLDNEVSAATNINTTNITNTCEFIAQIDNGITLGEVPINDIDLTCFYYDSDVCSAAFTPTSPPSAYPTSFPTNFPSTSDPTAMPTSVPTMMAAKKPRFPTIQNNFTVERVDDISHGLHVHVSGDDKAVAMTTEHKRRSSSYSPPAAFIDASIVCLILSVIIFAL